MINQMAGVRLHGKMRANLETGLKICSKCRVEQPLQNFSRYARSADGLHSQCKECARAASAEWEAKNPEKVRAKNRRCRYGISPEDVLALRQTQDGKCPGCQRDLTTVRECVDHDHATGKVRGLLCARCNTNLGMANDDPATLRRLVNYLELHGE